MHELLDQIEIEPSNLSQQLAVLRRAGLVAQRRENGSVVYSVSVPDVRDLLVAARGILLGFLPTRTPSGGAASRPQAIPVSLFGLVQLIRGPVGSRSPPPLPRSAPGRRRHLPAASRCGTSMPGRATGVRSKWPQRSVRCTTPNATAPGWWHHRVTPTSCW